MKRKAAADPGGGAVDLAAAVEAAKRKADARVQTIWVPGDSQGPQAAPETNFGSEEDARESLVSRGVFTLLPLSLCHLLTPADSCLLCPVRALCGARVWGRT